MGSTVGLTVARLVTGFAGSCSCQIPCRTGLLLGPWSGRLELGQGTVSWSVVESVDRGSVFRGEGGCGSCGPLGRWDCLGHRAVSGSVVGTEVCGSVTRGVDGHGSLLLGPWQGAVFSLQSGAHVVSLLFQSGCP